MKKIIISSFIFFWLFFWYSFAFDFSPMPWVEFNSSLVWDSQDIISLYGSRFRADTDGGNLIYSITTWFLWNWSWNILSQSWWLLSWNILQTSPYVFHRDYNMNLWYLSSWLTWYTNYPFNTIAFPTNNWNFI